MLKTEIPAGLDEINTGMEFIEASLNKCHIPRKKTLKALLLAEEMLVKIMGATPENEKIQIKVRPHFGMAVITLSARGEEMEDDSISINLSGGEMDRDCEDGIRSILLHAFSDSISCSRKGHYNYVNITAGSKATSFAARTAVAFIAAIICAVFLKYVVGEAFTDTLVNGVFLPAQNIFLNALQLVTAPTIFFSVICSISRYASFSDPGKVSIKVIIGYVLLSILAAFMGVYVFDLLDNVHEIPRLESLTSTITYSETGSQWILDRFVNLLPNNIIDPFLKTDVTQLLLMATLGGIALGRAGKYSDTLRNTAESLENFFNSTGEIISQLIPTAVFISTTLMYITLGVTSLALNLQLLLIVIAGFLAMIVVYSLLILILARMNPLKFLRKYVPTMWGSILSGSSMGVIPDTMRFCEKKLGISSKVHSFSVPFGAIANMDGSCVYLGVAAMFMAKLCGIDISGTSVIPVVLAIFILSVGAPLMPGTVVLSLALLINQMGVSMTIISFMLVINALVEMLLTTSNTIGDIAITLIVAKTEHLVDENVYNS